MKGHVKMIQIHGCIHGYMEVRDYFLTVVYESYHEKSFMEDKRDAIQRSRN